MNFVQFNYQKAMVNNSDTEKMESIHFSPIGITEWKDDLRKCMVHAGLRNTPTVFLFSDTQVIILFDLSSLNILIFRSKMNHFSKI